MTDKQHNEAKITGRMISGMECDTERLAWSTFWASLQRELYWCRGYKYWRVEPTLFRNDDFGSDTHVYRVSARFTASMKPIPGMRQITKKEIYDRQTAKATP